MVLKGILLDREFVRARGLARNGVVNHRGMIGNMMSSQAMSQRVLLIWDTRRTFFRNFDHAARYEHAVDLLQIRGQENVTYEKHIQMYLEYSRPLELYVNVTHALICG